MPLYKPESFSSPVVLDDRRGKQKRLGRFVNINHVMLNSVKDCSLDLLLSSFYNDNSHCSFSSPLTYVIHRP
uniref:Ovule protein n=1 Tax=Elaeophora elaphi TaxID=1147741 RepID=A0A0R3S0U6_9BILA